MKLFVLLLITIVALTACDDRLEFASRDNRPPKLYFVGDESKNSMTDSLKLGTNIKIGKSFYTLEISAHDPEGKVSEVNFHIESGNAKIFRGGFEVKNSVEIENGILALNIFPEQEGAVTIAFDVTDNIGKSAVATFTLVSFDNLTPVASAILRSTKITGPYEYEFDASASYDRDKNFGGEITAYEYVINDTQTILTSNKIIRHNFTGPGGYRVKYRVRDNEGAVSSFVIAPQITLQ